MKNFRLTVLATAAILAGCSTTPMEVKTFEKGAPTTEAAVSERMAVEWNQTGASIKEGRQSVVLLTPMGLPRDIRSKPVSLELESGASITDLTAALARLGHSVILGDKDAGNKTFYLPRYEGNIGGLLNAITRVTDVWFTWHEGAIVVTAKEKVSVSFPQEAGLATMLEKELKNFGIEAAAVSGNAGMLSMEVTPMQLRRVKAYLERITSNAAVVTLQMAVVNVTMSQDAKQGIDWDGMALAIGPLARQASVDPIRLRSVQQRQSSGIANTTTGTGTSTGTGTGTSTGSTGSTEASLLPVANSAALMTGSAFQGLISTGNFSFAGMFNFLQKYGTTETRQNTVFKTVTGQEVSFKSVTEVPYVSELGATANQTTTASSVKTEKAKDGLELSMTPTYDAAANTVSVKLKLSLKAVIGFNELSAGNQVGKLTQPTTADRSFNDEIRLRPGQTAVVGGIVYDSVSDNRSLPLFLAKDSKWESKSLQVDRNVMFIVLRPAVSRLGDLGEVEADSLELVPNYPSAPVKVEQPRLPSEKPARAPASAPSRDVSSSTKPTQPKTETQIAAAPKKKPAPTPSKRPAVKSKAVTPALPGLILPAASSPSAEPEKKDVGSDYELMTLKGDAQ